MGLWSMSMMRSISSSPLISLAGRHVHHGAVELVIRVREQRVVDQRGLAGARHAGDAGEQPEREFGVDVLEIVAGGADRP